MAVLTRLIGTKTDNHSLPHLSQYGYMPPQGLIDLFKLKADLSNSVPGGAPILEAGTVVDTEDAAAFAGGILDLPNAQPNGRYRVLTGFKNSYPSLARTYAMIFKHDQTRSFYAFRTTNGVSMFVVNDGQIAAQFNDGSNRLIDLAPWAPNVWNSVVMAVDAAGVRCQVNDGPIGSLSWENYNAAPATTENTAFGIASATQAPYGKYALLGVHNRGLDDNEIASLSKGLAVFARSKNLTIGQP